MDEPPRCALGMKGVAERWLHAKANTFMGIMDVLAFLANLGSLAGFILTVYVYYKVRKLRREYALIYRVPYLTEKLGKLSRRLAELNNISDPSEQQLLGVLARIEGTLESIARNIGKEHKRAYLALKDQIAELRRRKALRPDKLDGVYGHLVLLHDRANNVVEDRKHTLNP